MSVAAGAVNQWLHNAGRYPLLTAAQEVTLGNQIRAWLDADNPDAKTIRRGRRAREKMIHCNLRLITAVAKKYTTRIQSNPSVSHEDLLQEGSLGLARAAEKFDPATGYKFSTYAYWWIRQSMGRMCDVNASIVKVTPPVIHTALKWRYRPEGQTLEEFAAERNQTVEKTREQLELWQRAQIKSLDAKTQPDEDGSDSMLDFLAADCPIEDDQDYAGILDDLKHLDGGVLRESLALLELAEEASPTEFAELLDCTHYKAKQHVNDARAQIREHLPSYIREAIVGPERQIKPAIIDSSPSPKPEPVRALVLAHAAVSAPAITMTQSIQPTQNGHAEVDTEALEKLVNEVQSEPAVVQPEAPRPQAKRKRKTAAEVQAAKESALISVVIDGTQYCGQPDHIARLLNAMKAA